MLSIHSRPESQGMLKAFNVGENSRRKQKVVHAGVRRLAVDVDVHHGPMSGKNGKGEPVMAFVVNLGEVCTSVDRFRNEKLESLKVCWICDLE